MNLRGVIITVLLVMLAGLQYRMWVGAGSFAHVDGLDAKVVSAQASNSAKDQRNEVLRIEVRDLKRGNESIEEKARSELGLVKKGETFFLLVED